MATYTLIDSRTLSAITNSVIFTSIPQTYTDLVIILGARTTGTTDVFKVQPNGATSTFATANVQSYGNNSTTFSGLTSLIAGGIGANSAGYTPNALGNASIYCFNYTNALNKSFSIDSSPGAYAAATRIFLTNGYWDTASAITSMELATVDGDFNIGSKFYLYGIKNS